MMLRKPARRTVRQAPADNADSGDTSGGITFRTEVPLYPPKLNELVRAVRDAVARSPFRRLDDLGRAVGLSKQQISEITRGLSVPPWPDVARIATAAGLDSQALHWLRARHEEALHERSMLRLKTEERGSQLAGRAMVTPDGLLPAVADFTDWPALGLHRPITRLADGTDLTEAVDDGVLPRYVPRDKDDELRPDVREGVRLLVVCGPSAAGKTRTALEAVRAQWGTWQLLVPTGMRALTGLLDDAFDFRHVVVWLDEVQDLLETTDGVEQVRRLLAGPGPTVLMATIEAGAEDRLRGTAGSRLLARYARTVWLDRLSTKAEKARAGTLRGDPWIADALASGHGSIAEYLAAGPQLVRRYELGREIQPVATAVLHAAVDLHLVGYSAPVPSRLLYVLHGRYPGGRDDWASFEAALQWLRTPVFGAASLFVHTPGVGDRVFDYVRDRIAGAPAEDAWMAACRHATPRVLHSLALAARRHGHPDLAAEYVRRAAAPGLRLADLLFQLGDEEALRIRADSGDRIASTLLARVLMDRGDENALVKRADRGDPIAAQGLALLYLTRGDETALQLRAARGDVIAARQLVKYRLTPPQTRGRRTMGNTTTAMAGGAWLAESYEDSLRERAAMGDEIAATRLTQLLMSHGEIDEVRSRALGGDLAASTALSKFLADRGDEAGLRRNADQGDQSAREALAELLCDQGNERELMARAASGDRVAAEYLARLLAARGDERQLAHHANIGNPWAAGALAQLNAANENAAELRRLADAGNTVARQLLAELLERHRQGSELDRRAAAGDTAAHRALVNVLLDDGNEDELAARAAAGDGQASKVLAQLLAARGDMTGLFARAQAGDAAAVHQWLFQPGSKQDSARLWRLVDQGHVEAKHVMLESVVDRHDLGGLLRLAAGWADAPNALARLPRSPWDTSIPQWEALFRGEEQAVVELVQECAKYGQRSALEALIASDYFDPDMLGPDDWPSELHHLEVLVEANVPGAQAALAARAGGSKVRRRDR